MAAELHPAAVVRVRESEPDRVQPLPVYPEPRGEHRVGTVKAVADTRMPDGRHVHPDLVRAPCLELDLGQARRAECLERVVVRNGGPAVRDDGEPAIARGVPGDRGVDRAAQRIGVALNRLSTTRSLNACFSTLYACSLLAITIRPVVLASIRCTIPCRSAAPLVAI